MARALIELLEQQLEAAYRADRFHGLRRNLEAVRPEDWDIAPLNPSVGPDGLFGEQPELSICDLVTHVAGAKVMWANRAFGPGTLQWHEIVVPGSRDMATMLSWLEENQERIRAGMASLTDDATLAAERLAPWGAPMTVAQMIGLIINHDLYHSGEINRQRGLIRGSDGWAR